MKSSFNKDAVAIMNKASPMRSIASVQQVRSKNTSRFPTSGMCADVEAPQAFLDTLEDDTKWLADQTCDAFARLETTMFVSGNGYDEPYGFLSYATAPNHVRTSFEVGYVATGTEGDFSPDGALDAIMRLVDSLGPVYRKNACFVMNWRTMQKLQKLISVGANCILGPHDEACKRFILFDYPVMVLENMPDIASDAFAIAFGDFRRGYLIVEKPGIWAVRDPYSVKPNVLLSVMRRVGGGVQDSNAIKLLKFATN